MMGTPEQVIKVSFKTNNFQFHNDGFISINSEQKEQTNKEKYVFYCSVSQIHIHPEKTLKKHQNDFFGHTYPGQGNPSGVFRKKLQTTLVFIDS